MAEVRRITGKTLNLATLVGGTVTAVACFSAMNHYDSRYTADQAAAASAAGYSHAFNKIAASDRATANAEANLGPKQAITAYSLLAEAYAQKDKAFDDEQAALSDKTSANTAKADSENAVGIGVTGGAVALGTLSLDAVLLMRRFGGARWYAGEAATWTPELDEYPI